jgi:hypothetical protein
MKYNEEIDQYITKKSLFLDKEKYDLAIQQIKNIVTTIKNGMPNGNTLTF